MPELPFTTLERNELMSEEPPNRRFQVDGVTSPADSPSASDQAGEQRPFRILGTVPTSDPTPRETSPVEQRERRWGMLCHLASLTAALGIPLGHILGPLAVWLIKRRQMPLVAHQGKESMNFQISMTLYSIPCVLAVFVTGSFSPIMVIGLANIVLVLIAAESVGKGSAYRYPFCLRLIR
ncbi:MAG: DUF4870 domain-containing protein [Pseudomonadota bacterium]